MREQKNLNVVAQETKGGLALADYGNIVLTVPSVETIIGALYYTNSGLSIDFEMHIRNMVNNLVNGMTYTYLPLYEISCTDKAVKIKEAVYKPADHLCYRDLRLYSLESMYIYYNAIYPNFSDKLGKLTDKESTEQLTIAEDCLKDNLSTVCTYLTNIINFIGNVQVEYTFKSETIVATVSDTAKNNTFLYGVIGAMTGAFQGRKPEKAILDKFNERLIKRYKFEKQGTEDTKEYAKEKQEINSNLRFAISDICKYYAPIDSVSTVAVCGNVSKGALETIYVSHFNGKNWDKKHGGFAEKIDVTCQNSLKQVCIAFSELVSEKIKREREEAVKQALEEARKAKAKNSTK